MKYVLDTSVVSALIEADSRCIDRLAQLERDDVRVPEPVFAEIAYGIARLPGSKKKTTLKARYDLVRSELEAAEWSPAVSDAFGDIKASLERAGTRIEDFDAAIAAHAIAGGAVLVTSNVRHMSRIKALVLENWLA